MASPSHVLAPMASHSHLLAPMARLALGPMSGPISRCSTRPSVAAIPRFLLPSVTTTTPFAVRFAAQSNSSQRAAKAKKKKNKHKIFRVPDLTDFKQWSLCDAIRYIRAAEVGQDPRSIKYDVAVRIRTARNGPVVRNRLRLPHPVSEEARIAVICPENSAHAQAALELGAVCVGEETIFSMVRAVGGTDSSATGKKDKKGKAGGGADAGSDTAATTETSSRQSRPGLPFNKLICHQDSEAALRKANLGRFLGPRGLMPSAKTNTIVSNIRAAIQEMIGAVEFRERNGVIRLPIGRLNFTPAMLGDNIRVLMKMLKIEVPRVDPDGVYQKMLQEVVLSSTNGPGFSLNGELNSTEELAPGHLCGPM